MGERQADKIEALQARVAELEGRCRAVTERASAAVELLREIQWNGKSHDEPVCPCCDENAPHALVPGSGQHAADCRLAALLPEDNFPWRALVAGEPFAELPSLGGERPILALRVVGREALTVEPPHVVDPLGRTLGPDPAMVATEDEPAPR